MKITFTKRADKDYQKLPTNIQKKADKQFLYLLTNYRHPSLRTRKKAGEHEFEGRIDYHYRLSFSVSDEEITILTMGPHDEGLGKK